MHLVCHHVLYPIQYLLSTPHHPFHTLSQHSLRGKCCSSSDTVGMPIFSFWDGLCDPIACSLLGGGVPSHNSGYKVTRLFPSIMLVCYFVPPPSFLDRRHSRGIPSFSPIVSSPSNSTTAAAALFFYPSKYRPACSHHC